ncbi:MAG: DNA gyrase inhibitor YacG [Pseudomonadota bacterium]
MSAKIEDLARRRAQRGRPASDGVGKTAPKAGRCPICGRPRSEKHRPFCSKRCAEIDLGRWLKETYRVETEEAPGEEGMPARGRSEE